MPVPAEYQRIHDHLYRFLEDARDAAGLGSTHQAYTMAQGVFQVFRRRLSTEEAIRFCTALPAGMRALFVADWDPDEPRKPFDDIGTMTAEVRQLRADHNFSPDDAIEAVARAVWSNVDRNLLSAALERLKPEAGRFWALPAG